MQRVDSDILDRLIERFALLDSHGDGHLEIGVDVPSADQVRDMQAEIEGTEYTIVQAWQRRVAKMKKAEKESEKGPLEWLDSDFRSPSPTTSLVRNASTWSPERDVSRLLRTGYDASQGQSLATYGDASTTRDASRQRPKPTRPSARPKQESRPSTPQRKVVGDGEAASVVEVV